MTNQGQNKLLVHAQEEMDALAGEMRAQAMAEVFDGSGSGDDDGCELVRTPKRRRLKKEKGDMENGFDDMLKAQAGWMAKDLELRAQHEANTAANERARAEADRLRAETDKARFEEVGPRITAPQNAIGSIDSNAPLQWFVMEIRSLTLAALLICHPFSSCTSQEIKDKELERGLRR